MIRSGLPDGPQAGETVHPQAVRHFLHFFNTLRQVADRPRGPCGRPCRGEPKNSPSTVARTPQIARSRPKKLPWRLPPFRDQRKMPPASRFRVVAASS